MSTSYYFLICVVGVFASDSTLNFYEDNLEDTHGKIIYSSVLFRHGDQSPIAPYPTDPYDESFWPEGWGQLTKKGKIQEYELGQWFRQRHKKLFHEYHHDLLKMNSSDTDRTIMSAELFLAGFLPASENEKWSNITNWQPIPVHSTPSSLDSIIAITASCDRYDLERDLVNSSPEMEAYYLEHKFVFDYVGKNAGYELTTDDLLQAIDTLLDLYMDLSVEESNNLTLPNWTEKVYPEPLLTVASPSFSNTVFSTEMRRLKAGPFIGSVIQDMNMKIDEKLEEKFRFYSGHDKVIAAVLTAMEIYNGIPPPTGSAVIIELREKDEDFVVTILYRNSSSSPPILLIPHGCSSVCTFDQFTAATAHLIPDNWEEECTVSFVTGLSYRNIFEFIVMAIVVCLLLILIISIIKLHIIRRKTYSQYDKLRNSSISIFIGEA